MSKKKSPIPKNYQTKFSLIPGVSGFQNLIFLPPIFIDYKIISAGILGLEAMIYLVVFTLLVPYMLVSMRPKRENVPLYKHIWWMLTFATRQRVFKYRKVGYKK